MQKPKFRTVEKSAWVFITNVLHPQKPRTMNRRAAVRCGYLATAAALLDTEERSLPTPFMGERISAFITRVKAARRAQAA